MSTPLQPFPAAARLVRTEHVVMAGAALALVVLVALPLAFLVAGSVTSEGGVTLAHFRDALSSRVYNLYETGALGPVAALAIVTMLIITAAIVLATRLGRASAVARAERAGVAQ
jgi:ABC-type spermidine/putrescine transport system permease subunit II